MLMDPRLTGDSVSEMLAGNGPSAAERAPLVPVSGDYLTPAEKASHTQGLYTCWGLALPLRLLFESVLQGGHSSTGAAILFVY